MLAIFILKSLIQMIHLIITSNQRKALYIYFLIFKNFFFNKSQSVLNKALQVNFGLRLNVINYLKIINFDYQFWCTVKNVNALNILNKLVLIKF